VRPWRQFTARKPRRFKDVARLVRNMIWSRSAAGAIDPAWRAAQVGSFAALPHAPQRSGTTIEHTAEYWNYWLRCPAAAVSGFEVFRDDEFAGSFLISRVGGSARIAALRLRTPTPDAWVQSVRLAAQAAAADGSTCEITGTAATPDAAAALLASGFRQRGALPLFLYDPSGRLADNDRPLWNPIDDDFAYVSDPANPFHT
jgi:hypothetical protein